MMAEMDASISNEQNEEEEPLDGKNYPPPRVNSTL